MKFDILAGGGKHFLTEVRSLLFKITYTGVEDNRTKFAIHPNNRGYLSSTHKCRKLRHIHNHNVKVCPRCIFNFCGALLFCKA